jgi:hypothetical protein
MDREWRDEVARQADAALGVLGILRRWIWVVSGACFVIGTGLLLYLPYYVVRKAGSMGTQIMGPRGGSLGASGALVLLAERLAAVSWPILLIFGLAVTCLALGLQIQRRGAEVFESTAGTIGRVRRQAPLGIARSPDPNHALEDTARGARQALTWSLWVSRTLFIVGLALFIIGAGGAVFGGHIDALVATLCVSSVASIASAALTSPRRGMVASLVRLTQLQAVLAGYSREASIIEEHLYQVMEHYREIRDPAGARDEVGRGVAQIASLLAGAAESIRAIAEPPADSDRGRPATHRQPSGA